MSVFYLFATTNHSGFLGALMTFASRVWYPVYEGRGVLSGLSALADQHIGGLLMWIPGGAVFMLAALMLFDAWLGEAERRSRITTR